MRFAAESAVFILLLAHISVPGANRLDRKLEVTIFYDLEFPVAANLLLLSCGQFNFTCERCKSSQ